MNQEFIKAVADKNHAAVRMMLSNELLFDPRGESFCKMLEYANNQLSDLFESERPSSFTIPSEEADWNDDTLSKMKRELNKNFSREKLAIFVEMAKYVGSSKAEEMRTEEQQNKKHSSEDLESKICPKSCSRKKTGTIITGSGAVIAITGVALESTLITVLGGAIVIGGVVLLTVPKQSKK